MQLEIHSNENDIRLYLRESLSGQEYLSKWISESSEFEELIVEAIIHRSSDMFLLARLYMDSLSQIPTKRGVREALKSLPEGTDDTYREAWDRICAQKPYQADIGRKIILWIICATRPLRVPELRYGLAIEEGDSTLDAEGLLDISSLTSFCAGLVVIDQQSNRINLVHPTTNEYFVHRRELLLSEGHHLLAVACTTYLLMDPFRGACSNPDDFKVRYQQNPFFGYASVNWSSHVRISTSKPSINLAERLLRNNEARAAAVQALVLNTLGASDGTSSCLSCQAQRPDERMTGCRKLLKLL